jgi:hypothetical protein
VGAEVLQTERWGYRLAFGACFRDTPNNGMHPTADSVAFMRETML